MGVPRFFVESSFAAIERFALSNDLAHRAARVMRLRDGDALAIFDGSGLEGTGRLLLGPGAQASLVDIKVEKPARESTLELTLGQPLMARDRLHYSIEKACELGVCRIVLVDCARSASSASKEPNASKLDHLRRIAISAIEQCGRTHIPVIEGPVSLSDFVTGGFAIGPRLVLDPFSPSLRLSNLGLPDEAAATASLLVGPEGGLTREEVTTAISAGFVGFALGPRILRTETAVVAGLSLLQATLGDWQTGLGTD